MLNKLAVVAAALTMSVSARAGINFDDPRNNDVKAELGQIDVKPVPAPQAEKARAGKTWTIMVFVNGKNNLEPFAIKNFNQMEMIGSSAKVNIVVEMGRLGKYDHTNGNWSGTKRYLVKKDSNTSNITSPVVQDLGKVDMGDYKSVIDFGNWAKAAYPADHYMLILWNHGSGWEKSIGPRITKGISYDDETNNHITTPQMAQILQGIGGVDVYGSDACLMQMAEVDYEIKDYAQYIVGSEQTEPGDGYTYNTFLGPIVQNPSMSAADVARTAVDAYSDHYQQNGEPSTQSYVQASAIPDLLKLVNDWAYSVTVAGDKQAVKDAVSKAQAYDEEANKDLYNFVELVSGASKSADVAQKGQALMSFIAGTLVGENKPTADLAANSHGIAVYLPASGFDSNYMELQWAKYSNWSQFVQWYQN